MSDRSAAEGAGEAGVRWPTGEHSANAEIGPGGGAATVRRLIDLHADQRSSAVFLLDPDSGCAAGFGDIQRFAWSLASQLEQLGVERGECVGFALDNGLSAAQLLLGAMYGGWVALPLNVRAGPEALGWMFRHSGCRFAFVSAAYESLMEEAVALSGQSVDVAIVENHDWLTGRPDRPPAGREPRPGDTALLIYTSGSVGRPKGVVHRHSSILAGAVNTARSHRLTVEDRALLVLPLYHRNAETVTLTPSLVTGASIVIPVAFNPSAFWQLLHAQRCTWAALGPSHVSLLTESEGPSESLLEQVRAQVRFLRSSSAPLAPALQRRFLERFGVPLLQAMGASEAGNVFTNPVPPGVNKLGSIGLPYGCETRIVDSAGNDVARGSVGEILVRGPSLMSGYLRDAETDDQAIDEHGWWHSGDLASQDDDGYYFAVGRSKELIIKAGVNIAPLEIDGVLTDHADVLEAAAVGVPDDVLGEEVCALVVLREGSTTGEHELIKHCESRLGLFKAPVHIRFVGKLPKNPTGKLQRHLLRVHFGRSPEEGPAPLRADAVTSEIAELWSRLLGAIPVRAHQDFFELGGDSLVAMQSVSELRRRFEVTLGLSDLFLHSTATRLAAVVLGRSAAAVKDHSGRVIPRSLESRRYALTKAQQGMWMQSQQNPDEPLYNESEAVLLRGVLDAGMLRASLQGVMDRHEVLRSTISLEEFGPVATVQNGTTLEYRLFDLREKADALGEMLVEEAKRPFDLEEGPGFRAALFCLGEREHVLLLMMHHVVTDRFSFGVVWREVAASYCAARRGERAALPDLLVQYGDYALWRRRETGTLALQAMKEFWLQQLDGAPRTVRWPGREGRTVSGSFVGAHHRTAIPPASADRIREASRRQAASLFSIFATAFSTLLHRACAQDEIVLGIPVADREAPELQPLVGYLVDMHAVRVDHRGSPTFPELLRRVRARLAEAIAHSSVSFVEVFEAMELVSDPVRPPIVQVALNWRDRNAQLEFIGLEGLEVEPVYLDTGMAKFELGLVMTDTGAGGEIRLEWEYRKEWFDAGQIDLLAEEFASVLEEAANGL